MITNKPLTISFPNEDTYLNRYVVLPKDVAIKGYKEKIGKTIDFAGSKRKVLDVRVTDKFVFIDLGEAEVCKFRDVCTSDGFCNICDCNECPIPCEWESACVRLHPIECTLDIKPPKGPVK